MKSPFPGMDPFLEQHWGDLHHSIITYARDQLQPRLPEGLRARVEERVFVEGDSEEKRGVYPDVRIAETRPAHVVTRIGERGVATVDPLVVEIAEEPVTQGFIQVVDARSGHKVITVIEFLSPSNKLAGPGQDLYIKKQQEVLAARASLVEVDLTRAGQRASVLPVYQIPPSHRATYLACVRRGYRPFQAEIYALALRDPLPTIAVPLREGENDVPLDLQALIDLSYLNGRYDDLDYRALIEPPLSLEEAAWAKEVIAARAGG